MSNGNFEDRVIHPSATKDRIQLNVPPVLAVMILAALDNQTEPGTLAPQPRTAEPDDPFDQIVLATAREEVAATVADALETARSETRQILLAAVTEHRALKIRPGTADNLLACFNAEYVRRRLATGPDPVIGEAGAADMILGIESEDVGGDCAENAPTDTGPESEPSDEEQVMFMFAQLAMETAAAIAGR